MEILPGTRNRRTALACLAGIALCGAAAAFFFWGNGPDGSEESSRPKPHRSEGSGDVLPGSVPAVKSAPVVVVLTCYPDLPAASVEKQITNRMEGWVGQAPGMRRVESRSVAGVSVVTCAFPESANLQGALATVNSLALATVTNLPPGTRLPEVVLLDSAASLPVGLITLGNPTLEEGQVRTLAQGVVCGKLGAVPGVLGPLAVGGKRRTLHLHLDRDKLTGSGLTVRDVWNALREAGDAEALALIPPGGDAIPLGPRIMDKPAAALNGLRLRSAPPRDVYLRDVGQAGYSIDSPLPQTRVNGSRMVCVHVYRKGDTRPDEVREAVVKALPRIEEALPRGTKLTFIPLGSAARNSPPGDSGLVRVFLRFSADLSLDQSEQQVIAFEQFVGENIPTGKRALVYAELGLGCDRSAVFSRNAGSQDATVLVQLSAARSSGARQLAAWLRRLFHQDARFAGLQASFETGDLAAAGGRRPRSAVDIQITGGSLNEAVRLTRELRDRVRQVAGTVNVECLQRLDVPQTRLKVDPQKAKDVGLSSAEVMRQVFENLHGDMFRQIDAAFALTSDAMYAQGMPDRDPPAWTIQPDPARPSRTLQEVLQIAVVGARSPRPVKLGDLVVVERSMIPGEIRHVNRERVFTVRAEVEGRAVRDVAADVQTALRGVTVPRGLRVELQHE
jgi:multidrug efflux pump subunit AcrB